MDQSCPYCQAGLLRPRRTTYLRVIGNTLLHLPNADARRCDICGSVHFDLAQVRLLDLLAGEAGPPPNRHSAPPPVARAEAPRAEAADSAPNGAAPSDDAHTPKPRSR